MGHRAGEDRTQGFLFPVAMDELVPAGSIVRVIDAWAGSLDMSKLGFSKARPQVLGAPPYDPADLLRLYVWGYLNSVRSSRKLERECHRNVECMWLLRKLAPDHKTIAQFRREHPDALAATCACFVEFARQQRLIGSNTVAIDGTKIRAVASRKSVLSSRQLKEQARRSAEQIAAYMQLLDQQDAQEEDVRCTPEDVLAALRQLQRKGAQIEEQLRQLEEAGVKTLVQTEPDAQLMTSGPGYNVQTAVEATSHLIVHHTVVAEANDERQLQPMAEGATRALQTPCTAVADAGYVNGRQISALDDQNITTFVAPARSANNTGLLERSAFTFDAQRDCFVCPAGNLLTRKKVSHREQKVIYEAATRDCSKCPRKPECTRAPKRSVVRSFHEDALQANAQRVHEQPQMMKLRRSTVEHPFADLKHRILGNARFLVRGKRGATAETSIAVLAYNLKRVFNMKSGPWMIGALQG